MKKIKSETVADLEGEIWIPVKDFEGYYEVSNKGRIRSCGHYTEQLSNVGEPIKVFYNGNLLRFENGRKNYKRVTFSVNGTTYRDMVHHIVLKSFIGEDPNKKCVDHIDGNPENNCVENLRWVTHLENNNNPITLARLSEAIKGSHNRPPIMVDRCDDNWNVLETYLSLKEARRCGYCNVAYALKSATRTHKGYKWKEHNEN